MRRILMTGDGYTKEQFERLSSRGFEVIHNVEIAQQELISLLPTIDAHILGGSERLDATALESAIKLQVVSFVGTGYGAFVDEAAARARGIVIVNTPGVMAPTVAEHTIGLLLGAMRGLFAQNEAVKRSGSWPTTTLELWNSAIGIVGMGEIGTRVARILTKAFGCTVAYASRSRKPDIESELGLTFVDIDQLFATVNAILLFAPETPETTNIVDAIRLSKARPGLILVNTASPRLVEASALKSALESGQVAVAAFDGYWIEPLPKPTSDPFGLLALPDKLFVVTPHMAAKTTGTWGRMVDLAVNNIITAFENSRAL